MIFLQEGIAGGIYIIVLFFVGIGLIIIALLLLNASIKQNRKRKEKEQEVIDIQHKGNEIPAYVNYTIAFVILALALVLLNWVCHIKFD
jgi:ABC-type nickel/cobalt efflux system permease component RcnA